MRLFVALDIDEKIREQIARFMERVRAYAPDARWAKPESLHVTLKFIGERPEDKLENIKSLLSNIQATPIDLNFLGYGFFPTERSARVFWAGIKAGTNLAELAASVENKLVPVGIEKEERGFNPHLTLARAGRSAAPHQRGGKNLARTFQRLQEKLTGLPAPEFGTMTARSFFLYRSQLSSKGSQYSKLAEFLLN
jgi:RNA 2',3'-cyclic 3'-phosphodiesterase